MFPRILKITLLLVVLSVLALPNFVLGQEDLAQICQLEAIEQKCDVISQAECRQLLEKCEKYYQEESEKSGMAADQKAQEARTIQNQISILRSRIQQLDLQMQQGSVMIKDLSYQIKDTEGSIEQTSLKIDDLRGKLAANLQIIYEEDQTSIIEIFLSGATLSDFFDNLMALETLNLKSQEFLGEIKNLKETLEGQKQSLDTEKGDLEKVVKIQALQKQQSQTARSEQEYFLKLTEAQKQQYLKEKEAAEKSAAEIRERLFRLIGIPDIQAPTFGEALQIADAVTRVVKIRPAFLLGVISAESALGRNVGQCYVTNAQTGGGACITNVFHNQKLFCQAGSPINRIMHPTRDLPIFLRITGDNFSQIPVSCWIPICYLVNAPKLTLTYNNISLGSDGSILCPQGYAPYGFGGAMGPAQFIPSTWAKYEGEIRSMFGIANPNPWNVYDSFAASALYLHKLGAGQKTLAAERNAANRYSGGYSWYASDVMQRASCVQEFIDKGVMSSACQQLIF